MPSQHDEIQRILKQYSDLLAHWNESKIDITNYSTLLESSIRRELSEELDKLKELFAEKTEANAEDIIRAAMPFKELCRLRQIRNQGTCLSYTAKPEGDCNKLYFALAKVIFQPKSVREMIAVLLPDVKRAITVSMDELLPEHNQSGQRHKLVDKIKIELSEIDLASKENNYLDAVPCDKTSVFTQFVLEKDHLFDLSQMQLLPLCVAAKAV